MWTQVYPQEQVSAEPQVKRSYGDKKTALAPEAEVSFVQANATQPGLLCMGPA